jgi:hypothetical protein
VPWVPLRSRRDPAFWVPLLATLLLLVPLVLVARCWSSDWIGHLRELAAAKAQAVRALRLAAWFLCLLTAGFSAYLFRYFQLGGREGRLPPSGWWSFGAFRILVGPKARRASQLGMMVSLMLFTAAVGFALVVEHLIRLIEAGRLSA